MSRIIEKYIISESYRLRKEKNNICLYRVNDIQGVEAVDLLHPSQAIILALFDGNRTMNRIYNEAKYLFEADDQQVKMLNNIIDDFIKKKIIVPKDSKFSRKEYKCYNPVEFILSKSDIKFDTPRLSRPLEIVWHLTERCSCDCIYCYNERPFYEEKHCLSAERIIELAQEMISVQVNDVQFSGGEPLLYPQICEILTLLCKNNIGVYLSTKSFIDENKADILASTGLNLIQISIDSLDSHRCFIINGQFDHGLKMLQSIGYLKKRGIKVNSNTVVTSLNIDEIPKIIERLIDLGVNRIGVAQYGKSIFNHQDSLYPEGHKVLELIEVIADYKARGNPVYYSGVRDPGLLSYEEREKSFFNRPRCGGLFYGCVIYPDGKLSICEQLPINSPFRWGNLKNSSLYEVWNDPQFSEILYPKREYFRGNVCYTCEKFEECNNKIGRCIRNTLQAYNDYWMPDPRCPKAPRGKRIM